MIFRRSLLREFSANAVGVFFILLAITMTVTVIRYLRVAASGSITPESVLALLGFTMLTYLNVLLALTLFIAVLITIARGYRDSEMLIWFSSGVSLVAWARPVLMFAAPLVITIAVLSLVLAPWALNKREQYQNQVEGRNEIATMAPGVFKDSPGAQRVYFVEQNSKSERTVSNVFVHSTQHEQISTVVAKTGFHTTEKNGDQFLILLNGRRYEGSIGSSEHRITNFARYKLRIEAAKIKPRIQSTQSLSTSQLLRAPTSVNLGELAWRISIPISAVILALLAIPLGFVNPRANRSVNLLLSILIYIIYNNMLSVIQAWIAQEKIHFVAGLLVVHALMFLLLLALFYQRLSVYSLFRFRFRFAK